MEAVRPFTVLTQGVGAVPVMAHSKWHAIEIVYTIYYKEQPDRSKYRIKRKRRVASR